MQTIFSQRTGSSTDQYHKQKSTFFLTFSALERVQKQDDKGKRA